MDDNNQPRLDQWTDFAGKFLKAEHIKAFPITLACQKVDGSIDNDGEAHLFLEFTYNNRVWKWEVNKTNQNAIKKCGILKPLELNGKKITFSKILVRNPATNQMVDSLLVTKVE